MILETENVLKKTFLYLAVFIFKFPLDRANLLRVELLKPFWSVRALNKETVSAYTITAIKYVYVMLSSKWRLFYTS